MLKYRKGEIKSLEDVLLSDTIFTSYAKREKAGTNELKAAFQTDSLQSCVETILQKGEVQISSAERKEKLEKRKKEIVNFIHKYYIDPAKKLPHPMSRIENALEECKIRVDADIPVERQIPDIVSKLVNVIPLKKTTLEGQLKVPHSSIGAASSVIAKYVTVERESYSSHGCTYDIGIIPGEYDLFMSEINRVTKGNFEFNVYSQEGVTTGSSQSTQKKGKGNISMMKNKKGNK
ncbi:Ribosome maturation protein SDO1 [Galdieria sulphuraria]|nr:Ribosome maturation protein SDO1 [Galdieria sulphuraria]